MQLIFLDIDGVLNGHDFDEGAQSNTIRRSCIMALNHILAETEAKIVLSSAWRYMILSGALKLHGFEYMLRTHGACGIVNRIIGTTCADEDCAHCGTKRRRNCGMFRRQPKKRVKFNAENYPVCERCEKASTRGHQIARWFRDFGAASAYMVIDDDDFGITASRHPLIQTDGAVGLTMAEAKTVVRLLNRKDVTP